MWIFCWFLAKSKFTLFPRNMSSPTSKNVSETNGNKPKKTGKTNSTTKSGSMDTRAELADLIKKKAETSVRHHKQTFTLDIISHLTNRNNWQTWNGRYTPSRDPIWRTPNFVGTSFAAGSGTWPPTRQRTRRPTNEIASSRRPSGFSLNPASLRWLYVIVSIGLPDVF